MNKIKALAVCFSSLENCIKVQYEDFQDISRSEARKLGKLLHDSLTNYDEVEREKSFEEYRALRKNQEEQSRTRPVKAT